MFADDSIGRPFGARAVLRVGLAVLFAAVPAGGAWGQGGQEVQEAADRSGAGGVAVGGAVDGAVAGGEDGVVALESGAVRLVPPEQAELEALVRDRPAERAFSLSAGTNVVSHYVSRGQVYSSRVSFQPWAEVDAPLMRDGAEGGGPITGLSVFGGNWNSLQAGDPGLGQARTGNRRVQENWYEADLYGGFRVALAERWLTSLRFNYYTSPSDSWADIHEVDVRVTFNDAGLWDGALAEVGLEGFSVTPSIRIAKETRDGGGPEQWYFSPSLTPSYTAELADHPVTFTVPLVLGFGADGQYTDAEGDERTFGFFQVHPEFA